MLKTGILRTDRLLLRPFEVGDVDDVLEIARDWARAPGPDFDKWPTSRDEVRQFTSHLSDRPATYLAVQHDEQTKVIGLIAVSSIDRERWVDLGHVFLSSFQQNDLDREALTAVVDRLFEVTNTEGIVANNAPSQRQLAPLVSLGFEPVADDGPSLKLTRSVWSSRRPA